MSVLSLMFGFVSTCIVSCYVGGELVKAPLKFDPVTHETYIEQETNSGEIERITVQLGDLTAVNDNQKQTSTSVTAGLTKGGFSVGYSKTKFTRSITKIVKKGDKVELPMTTQCLHEKECRRDILHEIRYINQNGVASKQIGHQGTK